MARPVSDFHGWPPEMFDEKEHAAIEKLASAPAY
jgi:hypothetical protein